MNSGHWPNAYFWFAARLRIPDVSLMRHLASAPANTTSASHAAQVAPVNRVVATVAGVRAAAVPKVKRAPTASVNPRAPPTAVTVRAVRTGAGDLAVPAPGMNGAKTAPARPSLSLRFSADFV